MLLTLKLDITRTNEKNINILNELSWHVEKVYNSLLYEIKENKRYIDLSKSLNILSSEIYTEYRKTNWHSKYLHSHTMNIIYEREEQTIGNNYTNICAIYLGLNNVVAMTNKDNANTLLISGKEAKAKNKYILDKIKHLKQINMKMLKDSKKHKNTNRIKRLYEYRNNYMKTFMHKVSKMVVDYAVENKCNKIILGDLKGIDAIKTSESEAITKENYNPKRRIYRGLFVTNTGKVINADINGSLNILRKYIINYIPNLEVAMDNGREQRPIKKRVA